MWINNLLYFFNIILSMFLCLEKIEKQIKNNNPYGIIFWIVMVLIVYMNMFILVSEVM